MTILTVICAAAVRPAVVSEPEEWRTLSAISAAGGQAVAPAAGQPAPAGLALSGLGLASPAHGALSFHRSPTGDGQRPLGAPQRAQALTAAGALAAYAHRLERSEQRRLKAVKTWGLRQTPLRPPAPPKRKPEVNTEPGHLRGPGLPPVITRVPTEDKVVFLTIDDGHEKDPELLRMASELDVPYSAFISDYVAREDYSYFRRMRGDGVMIHNHTINHRELSRLPYATQYEEICAQQDTLEREIGERPGLFRPPYGAYNDDTLRAAAECGVRAVPLWAEEAFADRMEWGRSDQRLHPGDIILTHFRGDDLWEGSMTDMLRLVLDTVTEQGFALARLEDYL